MNFIGLDLSLRATGWADVNEAGGSIFGVLPKTKLKGVPRLLHLRRELRVVMPEGPSVIAVEGYSMGSKGRVFDIGEWGGIAKLDLYERGDSVVLLVPPSSLKMFVTGSGNAGKAEVVAAVNKRFGISTKDDNEADALGLALIARHWYRKPRQASHEARAMEKIKPCFPVPFSPVPARARVRTRRAHPVR